MKKSLFPFVLFAPVAANAGYVDKEMLDSGVVQFGGTVYSVSTDVKDDTPIGEYDGTVSHNGVNLELIGGVSPNINIAAEVSPIGQDKVEYFIGSQTASMEWEGVGDLKTELRFRLGRGDSYPVFTAGAVLPTGDDKDPEWEVKSSTGVLPGETGGRGNGRTDYMVGAGYFIGTNPAKLFLGTEYVINGKADGVHFGDEITVTGEGSFPVSQTVSLVGALEFQMSNDSTAGSGEYVETAPTIFAELGGMFSISEKTEIIAVVATMAGGKKEYFTEVGTKVVTVELERTVGFALTVRSRF